MMVARRSFRARMSTEGEKLIDSGASTNLVTEYLKETGLLKGDSVEIEVCDAHFKITDRSGVMQIKKTV